MFIRKSSVFQNKSSGIGIPIIYTGTHSSIKIFVGLRDKSSCLILCREEKKEVAKKAFSEVWLLKIIIQTSEPYQHFPQPIVNNSGIACPLNMHIISTDSNKSNLICLGVQKPLSHAQSLLLERLFQCTNTWIMFSSCTVFMSWLEMNGQFQC